MSKQITREQAIAKLWELGRISEFKLHAGQLVARELLLNSPDKIVVINSSRRWGKTHFALTVATELCIKKPGAVVKLCAPTASDIKKTVRPMARILFADCPEALRPSFSTQDSIFKFPNGSEIHIAGTDNGRAEKLRGPFADFCVVDEAGTVRELKYIVNSILRPQTLTTKGKILLISTPPPSSDHDFVHFVHRAKERGSYLTNTIHENPLLTPEMIAAELADVEGGPTGITARREYYAEIITDSRRAVIPEFNVEAREKAVQDIEPPPFYDAYVGIDPGFIDHTGVVFAYWDFNKAKLVVVDELLIEKATTDTLTNAIKDREQFLWNGKEPLLRVSDLDLRLVADLGQAGINVMASAKDNKEAAVNALRLMVAKDQLIIHPRCKKTIAQLEGALWNKNRSDFERPGTGGHYDLLDALIFIVRNLSRNRNPFPHKYEGLDLEKWRVQPFAQPSHTTIWHDVFDIGKFSK